MGGVFVITRKFNRQDFHQGLPVVLVDLDLSVSLRCFPLAGVDVFDQVVKYSQG